LLLFDAKLARLASPAIQYRLPHLARTRRKKDRA
jgi:hypothetical protein